MRFPWRGFARRTRSRTKANSAANLCGTLHRLGAFCWRILAHSPAGGGEYCEVSFEVGEEMFAGPEWEQLYQQALLELDNAKLTESIFVAEQAARKRLLEIQSNGNGNGEFEERHKLEDALTSLSCLRRISSEWSK